ncbi:Serine/threonine-protein kinase sik2 [Cichlidogyrus casuarinus]|uniref:non-specific serine/threonine protein kinase n=1 Tax=Cichlidogyrus casuarinus TaxID=1844966 RepID=A0ABD2QBZ3_9PLAT
MNLVCNQNFFGSNYDNEKFVKLFPIMDQGCHNPISARYSSLQDDNLEIVKYSVDNYQPQRISNMESGSLPMKSKSFIQMPQKRVRSFYQRTEQPKIGAYAIEETIGRGNFSFVKLATHTITNMKVAIKIIDKSKLSRENIQKMYREVDIMKKVYHQNIVTLYQIMDTTKLLYIVMEYVPNGELFEYIRSNGKFNESVAKKKFMGLLSAVEACHDSGIVHRDLKAENLLLDQEMNIKLAVNLLTLFLDFGFGTFCGSPDDLLLTWCGSPPYAAPEIFCGEPYIGTKADVWSLGVVLYVMVCGALPFGGETLPELKEQVVNANFRIPFWLSLVCEDLLRQMMAKKPRKRPSIKQIREHRWFKLEKRDPSKDRLSGGSSSQAVRTPCSSEDNESVLSEATSNSSDLQLDPNMDVQYSNHPKAHSTSHLVNYGLSKMEPSPPPSALNYLSNSRLHSLPTANLAADLKRCPMLQDIELAEIEKIK